MRLKIFNRLQARAVLAWRDRQRGRALALLAKSNQRMGMRLAALLLSSSTLISALLGIYRDRLLNSMYLDTYKVGIDAYTVAFSIPDFMYLILVSGALSVTFIPVFNARLAKNNRTSAWQMSASLINFFAVMAMIISVVIMIFAPWLVKYVVGPGLSESGQVLATSMMRVIAINPFLFSIASVIGSMQQAVGRFVFYAVSPIVYNIGIIIGAMYFTDGISLFGHQIFSGGIMGVAIGVVIGAILQLVVSVVGLAGLGFDYRFKIYWKNQGFRKVLSLLPTRSADQGLDYVSAMIDTNLASRMVDGTIRAYQQAGTLYNMPINLIGVAISTAAFPQLSDDAGAGDSKKFAQQLRSTLRTIIWLALPTAVGMFFVRGYLVSIIDRGGNGLIATLLGILCIATLLRSIFHLASRSFYAFQDTRTPFRVSLVTLFITVLLELWFVFGLHAGIIGVAWAQVIWALLELIALFTLIMHKVPRLFNVKFLLALLKMVVATACMAAATYTLVRMFNLQFANQNMLIVVAPLLLIVIVSALVYGVASRVLCLEEIQPIIGIVKKVLAGVLSGRQR